MRALPVRDDTGTCLAIVNVREHFLRPACARHLNIGERDIGPVKLDAKNVEMRATQTL
jgi:hypothetical protein